MRKRCISVVLATLMVFSLMSTTAFAFENNTIDEPLPSDIEFPSMDIPLMESAGEELEYSTNYYDLSTGGVELANLADLPTATSADAIVQEFSGYLSAEDEFQYVLFTMESGQIFNATLECPDSPYLDYGLLLCKVAENGDLTPISECNLGTYIDPQTNKTVDEGLSFVHNQASAQNYAILVVSSSGSSTSDAFRLRISIDVAGSFDRNEPNDNPFIATEMRMTTVTPASGSISGSLNTAVDQDWYTVRISDYGVFQLSAGDYVAEPYYATTGNKMVLATKAGANYILPEGVYYIEVSAAEGEAFSHGSYTLSIVDQSKYSTMYTAFDFGDWESIYRPRPETIPMGQIEAYFKFDIDTYERVYAYITDYGEQIIESLNANGERIDLAYTETPGDIITSATTGQKRLIVDADGVYGDTIYLHVIRSEPLNYYTSMVPNIMNRWQENSGTFTFTGTASNPGFDVSSSIYCDLTNNSRIPKSAIVDSITTTGSMSQSVGGVTTYLNPGGQGWLESRTSGSRGSFDLGLEYGVSARQRWEFKYKQTAFASTKMSSVKMTIYWYADINENNYERWPVGPTIQLIS